MNMKDGIRRRWGLAVSLVFFVFFVMLAAMILAGLLVMILHITGRLSFWEGARPEQMSSVAPFRFIVSMMIFSTFLGTAIAAFLSKAALKPIRKVVKATHKIAQGDFNVRVDIKGVYELEELSQSFNKMAHELSSIETLRSDFINNFSHEFKTPIVSVRGFAKLLKDGNLNEDEKQEYLDIIITESERLATLSTNVLTLSKYENIEIMPDKKPFHLDEQIRRAIVLMEPKWAAKDIAVDVCMQEIRLEANEDLIQQIWVNLLDNAIKFTDPGGTINIRLSLWNGGVLFTIEDTGSGMDENTKAHIFDKFYQGDTPHSKAGNGIGLAIVKRITELCGGCVEAQSELGEGSKFSIFLPI
ncbi:MAG: HAMP domain-containing histidine kinase [Peptococcaceae bacterium]|nr:HAMP domain-containing histidine kinase [Peptococcaceae bacterium]